MKTDKISKTIKIIIGTILGVFVLVMAAFTVISFNNLMPVDPESHDVVMIEVKKGWGVNSVIDALEKENLIKDAFILKIYSKLNNLESIYAGNYKLSKTDKVKYDTHNNENTIESEITEKIYNMESKLLYESKTKIEESFNSYKEQLLYRDDSPFINVVDIEKTWYMPNESIVRYSMNKNELYSKEEIQESFLICKKPYVNEFSTTRNFVNLGRDLFVELMSGKQSIEEVLESLKQKDSVKKKEDKK